MFKDYKAKFGVEFSKKEKFIKQFAKIDKNGDDTITMKELKQAR